MALGGAYGGDYALAYTGDDGLLTCAAYQTVYIGADGDAGLGPKLDAVLGYGRYYGGLYNLWIDAHLYRVEHVAAGKVDGARTLEIERYAGALRGDQCVDYPVHVAACKVVGLKLVEGEAHACLGGFYGGVDYAGRDHLSYAHGHQLTHAYLQPGGGCGYPQPNGYKAEEYGKEYYYKNKYKNGGDEFHRFSPLFSSLFLLR